MGAALSYHDAAYATVSPTRRDTKPAGEKCVKRDRKRPRTLVRVPDLNWPSNLFSDNAGTAELLAEDSPFQLDQPNQETLFQAAA